MGLTYPDVSALLRAKRDGMSFASTLVIGRQNLFIHRRELRRLIDLFELPQEVKRFATPFGVYADAFLAATLEIDRLTTLDASDYEGAGLVHDLNVPMSPSLACAFDAVIEAGTIEHVFNVPVAFASLLAAVRVGGGIYLSTPANNLCGHGFYQFSPELMFRIFSLENGFRLREVLVVPARFPSIELLPARRPYAVGDPHTAGERVGLMGRQAATMVVSAVRVSDAEPLLEAPTQSDYAARWETGTRHGGTGGMFRRIARGIRQRRRYSLGNRDRYVPL